MALPFTITGFDHVRFYVGNAKQASYYYQTLYGFEPVAFSGLETGQRDSVQYWLKQRHINFIIESPLQEDSPINVFLSKHGDAVRDIAFTVDDAVAAWEYTTQKGAESAFEPTEIKDDNGKIVMAAVKTYGDTIHTFIQRSAYKSDFLPGFAPYRAQIPTYPTGLIHIDHIVGNQPEDEMERVVLFYQNVFDFHRFWSADDKDISTEYSSLRSIVVANDNEVVKMPINEPAEGLKKSQIQEYIDFNAGAGVQHIAVSTQNIVDTVSRLIRNGVEFLDIPNSYYDSLAERVGDIDEDIENLRKLGILVDRDEKGYMLQLFTRPVEDRPTLFLEVIQRKGSNSFGKGNFKALFESIEREQARRGNL
jgi:4-hydroxyphenylpyruvate dioxygenase